MARSRWLISIGTAVLALVALVSGSAPAQAQDRTQLRSLIVQARTDLQNTAAALPALNKQDTRLVRTKLDRLRADASSASAALSAAVTTAQLDAASRLIHRLSAQAAALLRGTRADGTSLAAIATTRGKSVGLVRAWSSGSVSDAAYGRAQTQWSRAGAWATLDHQRALDAIRSLTVPPAPTAAGAIALATSGRTPAAVRGLTAMPGGCALPSADVATYVGDAAGSGIHLWTSDAQVSRLRQRLAASDAGLASAQRHVIGLASKATSQPGDPTSGGDLTTRALRIGYAWLSTSQSAYGDAIARDVSAVTGSLTPVEDLVDEAKIAQAVATDVDWLLPSASAARAKELRRAREVLLVRSLGTMSCAIALNDDVLSSTLNKGVIVAASAATTALGIARDHPAEAAAAVAAAVKLGGRSWSALAADGGTPEGPTYWNFQTVPLAGMLSSMDSAYGGRALTGVPDFRATALFGYDAPSPQGQVTRYSDTDTGELRCTLPAWIAGRWGGAQATALALQGTLRQGVELLWWPTTAGSPPAVASRVFPATGLATIQYAGQTAWLKGQAPLNGHTQLDAGTVGLTAGGVEWTVDPGYGTSNGDGYSDNAPGGRRWTFPQAQPAWHTTVRTAGGVGQVVGATAGVTGDTTSARVDLTRVLGAVSASRSLALNATQVTLRDVVDWKSSTRLTWGWLTDAQIAVSGRTVTLSKDGRTLTLSFEGLPASTTMSVQTAPPLTQVVPGRTVRSLVVSLPASTHVDLTVRASWR